MTAVLFYYLFLAVEIWEMMIAINIITQPIISRPVKNSLRTMAEDNTANTDSMHIRSDAMVASVYCCPII